MKRETLFSKDRLYRYTLWRDWSSDLDLFDGTNDGGRGRDAYVQFIGLNPSTADETKDDPTIRRCIRFAKDWGYGGLCMTNLFAFRSTDPSVMLRHPEPIGPENDAILFEVAKGASLILAAWGVMGCHKHREQWLVDNIGNLKCLGVTDGGHPRHPLYVAAATKPIAFPIDTEQQT